MWKIKNQKYSLKQVFQDAVEEKRKGVKIEYIWLNECHKCHSSIPVLDEEYSFEYTTQKESVSLEELLEVLDDYNKSYSIYENKYEEETKNFEYIGLDEYRNEEVFYYYVEDSTTTEWCDICKKVF